MGKCSKREVRKVYDVQTVMVRNKPRKAIVINGVEYVREICYVPVYIAELFEKTCQLYNEKKSKMIVKLIQGLTQTTGFEEDVKSSGNLLFSDPTTHLRRAVSKTLSNQFPFDRNF